VTGHLKYLTVWKWFIVPASFQNLPLAQVAVKLTKASEQLPQEFVQEAPSPPGDGDDTLG
jgi:hypothetical protein